MVPSFSSTLGQFPLKGYWKWEMFYTIIFFLFWVIISFLCITYVSYYVGDDSEAKSVEVDVVGMDVVEVDVLEVEVTQVDVAEVDNEVDFSEVGVTEMDFLEVAFAEVDVIEPLLEVEKVEMFDWAGSA